MKKNKLLAVLLALAMTLSLLPTAALAAETQTIIDVTAENAQAVLDGAQGSIDGKTINFTESINTVLHIGRPTKYEGSNTSYYVAGFTDAVSGFRQFNTAAELTAYKSSSSWTPYCYYSRTISNVKFTSNENVTLAGFDMSGATGHNYQPGYDYVRDLALTNGTNDGYYGHININGLTFEGLTINNTTDNYAINFYITSCAKQNELQNIAFNNCSISSSKSGAASFMNNGGTADIYKGISFNGCTLNVSNSVETNTYGVLTYGVGDLTVNGCRISGMTRAVQTQSASSGSTAQNEYGKFIVTNNTFDNVKTYVIKVAATSNITGITITGNTSTNSASGCQVRLEPSTYAGTGECALRGNTWDSNVGYKYPWNKDPVAEVDGTQYTTLAEAITAAESGQTVTLLKDVDLNSDQLQLNKAITIDGGAEKHSITSKNQDVVKVLPAGGTLSGTVKLSNLRIKALDGSGRAIGIGSSSAITGLNLTVENCEITTKQRGITVYGNGHNGINLTVSGTTISLLKDGGTTYDYDTEYNNDDTRGISLWKMGKSTVSISGSTIQGFAYSINNGSQHYSDTMTVNIESSTLKGRAAINDHTGGTKWNLTGTAIRGINNQNGPSESFGCIVFDSGAGNNTCNVNNCVFTTYFNEVGGENAHAKEFMFVIRADGNTVKVDENSSSSSYTILNGDKGGVRETGVQGDDNNSTIALYGGTYSTDPSAHVAQKHAAIEKEGVWTIGKLYTATFTTAPESATVTVKKADGTEIQGIEKTFADLNSALTYNYTVSRSGYYSKSGTIDASGLTWDGTNNVWNLPVIHVALSAIPSDSDSSGSSSTTTPSQPTTSTETKPDGSTTTTESKPDGTVTESNTSKPVTGADGSTSQTTTETTTGKDGVTESKTETVTKPDGSASSTTESTTTKPDGTKTESTTETTVNKDGSTASTTTATTTNKDGTVTESKTEATTSTVTNKDGSTTETKQETTTTSTGSKTESTTVTTVNKDGSTTATTTATTTDKAGTVTESKTESTTNKNGTTTEKTTTTETKANGTVTESKTETTINKDGSSKATTTATVTKADGTKVESKTTATTSLSTNKATGTVTETKKETTTTSDGVKSEGTTVTQIRKDGTVTSTETVKASDSTGTTATKTTTLDAKGEVTTTAEVSVSSKAVTEAAKTGVAVTIPVEVTATKSASTAPTVSVSVPKTAESVKVELPVQNVTPGTVAVIVNADGTEKIVSTSMVTENGVALKLDGSATVKLVDNAKRFTDVPETNVFYNEISSLSARNIMIGVSNEKFDLHNSVTLNQTANVAGRITGAVDVSDFNAGVAWGQANGLKIGNNAATRGDVLKALYIAAGSPAVEDTSILTRFKDASSIPADLAAIAAWAAQNGILKGNMDGTAGLSNNVTRGQACALAGRTMGTLA